MKRFVDPPGLLDKYSKLLFDGISAERKDFKDTLPHLREEKAQQIELEVPMLKDALNDLVEYQQTIFNKPERTASRHANLRDSVRIEPVRPEPGLKKKIQELENQRDNAISKLIAKKSPHRKRRDGEVEEKVRSYQFQYRSLVSAFRNGVEETYEAIEVCQPDYTLQTHANYVQSLSK